MTAREKRFEKIILAREPEYKFQDVRNFLEYRDYFGKLSASSHITFRKEGHPSIVIVVHNNKVKRVYIKDMLKILIKRNIL